MLAQKDDEGKERVIYYISKTLINYEIRYTPIDKILLKLLDNICLKIQYMLWLRLML